MSDAIHSSLADLQASLTASCRAASPDGSVHAEATARRQLALDLSPAALKLSPDDLADLILATQRQAQTKAEALLTESLDAFRTDPRVAATLDTLRDTQANPTPAPRPTPTDVDADFTNPVRRDLDW